MSKLGIKFMIFGGVLGFSNFIWALAYHFNEPQMGHNGFVASGILCGIGTGLFLWGLILS